ncbi:MAG: hypothetical protein WKF40_04955 [Thermoleophilaceae bacterium]
MLFLAAPPERASTAALELPEPGPERARRRPRPRARRRACRERRDALRATRRA